ncbi:nuclear pore complex subunit, partial [Coemansia biformis]
MPPNTSLSSLLEESKRLTTHLTLAEIPAVQRGIDLLESESRKLVARSVRDGRTLDPRAQTLLASSGVDTDRLADSSGSTALLSAFEMLHPVYDANVESFLGQQQEQAIVNAIEESELATLDDFDRTMTAHMQTVWEEAQRRLFEELGQHQGAEPLALVDAEVPRGTAGSAAFGAASGGYGQPSPLSFDLADPGRLRVTLPRVERYAQVARKLNDARVAAATRTIASAPKYDLLAELGKATAESGQELKSKQLGQTWKLLGHYTASTPGGSSGPVAGPRRDEVVVSGACAYLEETFVEHVERIVAQYPHDANVGGVPSIHRRIQGYLNVQFGRLGRVPAFLEVFNNEAIWAHMYMLYRCGHRQELLKYALEMEDIITDSDPGFVAHLKAFFDQSPTIRGEIPVTASSLEDPYKAALYKVLGRGNVPKKATVEVVHTTEDYLWSNLVLIRDAATIAAATSHARSTLPALQALMLKFGAAHFDPNGNNPLLYLRVLLLCGLLENAIDYLLQIDRYQIEAVHMGILLAHHGLLAVPATEQAGSFSSYLVSADGEPALFDFMRMITHYARALPEAATDDAVNYLLLLTLPGAASAHDGGGEAARTRQRAQCEQALVRLLYERREYAHYLGDIQSDGTRKRGYLERLLPLLGITSSEQFSQTIIRRLADRSRDEGRLADTVLLYNLGERYNTVLNVLCKQLGELLYLRGSTNGTSTAADVSSPSDPMVLGLDDVEGVARAVLEHYKQREHIARALEARAVATCNTLLLLLSFLNSHRCTAYEEALATIERTQLLPLDGDVSLAGQHAEKVRNLDESITRNVSLILLATMDTLSRLYAGLKESPFVDAIKQANMLSLRRKARTLM